MEIRAVEPSKYQHLSDDELLVQYQMTRNNQWLSILLERYTMLLLGYCMKNLKDEELAKEAVQQVQLKVFESAAKQKVEFFRAWIVQIAKNECSMQFRHQQKLLKDIILVDLEEFPQPDHTAERERGRLLDHLPAALNQVSAAQRECLTLFYLNDLSYKDITQKTGYSYKEIKSHIQNGKRALKNILKNHGK